LEGNDGVAWIEKPVRSDLFGHCPGGVVEGRMFVSSRHSSVHTPAAVRDECVGGAGGIKSMAASGRGFPTADIIIKGDSNMNLFVNGEYPAFRWCSGVLGTAFAFVVSVCEWKECRKKPNCGRLLLYFGVGAPSSWPT
jgi:hypothetical protein